jgi:hypothetical protein
MRRLGVTLGTLFGLLMVVAVASPALADPPGNNGDVKIEFSGTQPPNMEPHVPCTFNIEFYNYDEGDMYGDYSFALQPPTGTSTLLSGSTFIGEDAAGGGTDIDASVAIDLGPSLSGVTPHPIQGYHIKVTVHADGSIGADTKYKVFWVKCGPSYVPGPTATGDTLNAASNSPVAPRPDWGIVGLMVVLFGTPAFLVARRIRRIGKAR